MHEIFLALLILSINAYLFAQDPSLDLPAARIPQKREEVIFKEGLPTPASAKVTGEKYDNLSELQKQARLYRNQGLALQKMGNIDQAMSLYQKAIQLEPTYAVSYNDLGTVYEAKGMLDQAEASYLQAIILDPSYLSPYSNLALLYENKRDLDSAYTYWKKRADLGSPSDPWTQKSRKRLEDLMQIVPSLRQRSKEEETVRLMKDTAESKRIKKLKDIEESKRHIKAAENLSSKREYQKALEELNIAQSFNGADMTISEKIDKVKGKIKEEQKEEAVKNIEGYFQSGIRLYRQDNLQAARQEFERIIELTAAPQEK